MIGGWLSGRIDYFAALPGIVAHLTRGLSQPRKTMIQNGWEEPGSEGPRADHARALTRLALEMRDHVCTATFRGQTLQFRIGLNSGPVVAGVIGRKKFIYD